MTPEHGPTQSDDLVCNEVVEVVTDYLEGAMPEHERHRFEAHLGECPYCTEYVEQMRMIGGSLKGLGDETIAPETRGALLAAFRGWRDR